MSIRPKPFLDNFKLRHKAYGVERRRNMSKIVLEHSPNFPLSVELNDIDDAVNEWADKSLSVSCDGKRVPLFKMFSNQRIHEYSQTWEHLDDSGNLLLNFKTITRDNNPKKGTNQGESYNIPGNRKYPMFIVPVLQENGEEAYDIYSMKQPFTVDMYYSLMFVTDKYEMLNEMNQMVNDEFKSIDRYIAPHGYYMPMVLDDISDESAYNIDDRKYYSQTYKIKVKAFIIRKEDFEVTKAPSRACVRMLGLSNKRKNPYVEIEEEDYIGDDCCIRDDNDPYYNKLIKLKVNIPQCKQDIKFTIDTNMVVRKFETNNVYDFVMSVNGEFQDLNSDDDIKLYNGDEIYFEIEQDDTNRDSSIIVNGFDPDIILDSTYNPESDLDEDNEEDEYEFNA